MGNENQLYSISLGVASLQGGLVGVATALSPATCRPFQVFSPSFFVGLELTVQGQELRNQLRGVSEQIERAQRSLSGRDLSLLGAIRVTTTDTLMHGLLMPYLAEFRALNPAMQMEIVINNTFLNLTRREADIAVRPSNIVPENLVGRRVGRLSERYLCLKELFEEKSQERM